MSYRRLRHRPPILPGVAALLVTVAVALGTPGLAVANIFDVYGMGARGIGTGGAQVASANDYTATYYNPAALTQADHITFGVAFMMTVPKLQVTRGRPVCLDAAPVCAAAYGQNYSDREAAEPGAFSGFMVGWAIPFGGIFENHLAAGVVFYVPTINLVRAEALDPQTPQFYMYQNLPDQLAVLASVAYEPFDWLSVGAGIQVLADLFGSAAFDVDAVNGALSQADLSMELLPNVSLVAGIHVRPLQGLDFGLTYRQEHGLEFAVPSKITVGDAISLELEVAGSVLYRPHTVVFGASYTLPSVGLTLSAQLDWALWSLAPDPSPYVAVKLGGTVLDGFGLGGALDVGADQPEISLGFTDTVTPRLGLEWAALSWLDVQAGYYYRPSPAPLATGPWSYLDNDVHALSLGLDVHFDDPFVSGRPISLGLGGQIGILPGRTVIKDNRADPVGDLEHGGYTLSFSFTFNQRF